MILRAFGWLFIWIVIFVAAFFTVAAVKEYTPDEIEDLRVFGEPQILSCDTVRLLSWNIGYAGLGSDMDFFMDGGESSRTSRGRTLKNLRTIADSLKTWSKSLDFIFLQEVDIESKRGYGMNEYDTIVKTLGSTFKGFYAPNFKSFYVPIPLSDPIGSVNGGLASFSRYTPQSVKRIAFPSVTPWPQSMFDLKRGMLSLEISLGNDRSLYMNNTHNSAYDDGDGRAKEISYLRDFLSEKKYSVTAGDWNSTPPDHVLSQAEKTDEHFSVQRLNTSDLPSGFEFVADLSTPSARYGYEPFDRETTTTTIIDVAAVSPSVEPISVRCIDLGFESSDHNPVLYTFVISPI